MCNNILMKNILFPLAMVFTLSTSFHSSDGVLKGDKVKIANNSINNISADKVESNEIFTAADVYNLIDFGSHSLNQEVFEKAFTGFEKLKKAGQLPEETQILTVCDFSLSSNEKRLWVIDMSSNKVLFNTLVAHGKNTGEEFATQFSNTESSYQSSLGFYVTDVTYQGSNGYSLKLLGMDKGFNDAALKRAIVMHGADYVSENFAAQHQRIGRSWGCPAVPRELADSIINTIKGKNCLFIYYPDQNYLQSSEWLQS